VKFLWVLLLPAALLAQTLPDDRGAAGLWQAWKRAENRVRILYVTAHPDDEDAGTLAYLARGLGADVTLVSLTRGEGGANVITADFFDALALLRQLELEKACAHYGVKLRFTTLKDFGYSKNVGETWKNWNQGDAVRELGEIVQEVRPHILMAKFHGSARDGHGHHTASGEATKAAYRASQSMPWAVRKLYTGNWNEKDDWTLRVDAAVMDPVLGRTYQEIGVEGYRWHRSQGMDRMLDRPGARAFFARAVRHYKLEASRVGVAAKEDSILERLGDEILAPAPLREGLAKARAGLRLENPAAIVPALEALAQAHPDDAPLRELLARAQGRYQAPEIKDAPGAPVSVRFTSEAGILRRGEATYAASVMVRSLRPSALQGELHVGGAMQPFRLEREGEEVRLDFTLPVTADTDFAAVAKVEARNYSTEIRPVTAPGLRTAYLRKPALHHVRVVDVRVAPNLRVGYVMGTGDEVPAAIRQLGVPVAMLSPEDLAQGDLARFTTIVLGIRAYAAREDVRQHNARLLEFARKGGVVIVQYNTQEYDKNYGPYPYSMTDRAEEISEEDSPVKILAPNHPVFTAPNRITPADFDGWLEQRGSKFFTTWDDRYTPLVETQDTGQAPQRGGWLEAKTGQGLYIYCAYAWYRQLPAAVPGATRLFANLLSRRP